MDSTADWYPGAAVSMILTFHLAPTARLNHSFTSLVASTMTTMTTEASVTTLPKLPKDLSAAPWFHIWSWDPSGNPYVSLRQSSEAQGLYSSDLYKE